MTAIKEHASGIELEARYKTATDPVAKSHFHALWLLSSGYEIGEVAAVLSFSTRWIRLLIHRYNEGGPEALGDRRAGNGAAPKILPAALAALKKRIRTPLTTAACGAGRRSRAGWSATTTNSAPTEAAAVSGRPRCRRSLMQLK
jgi:hypothetical protein